jgi:ATP-dependent DNA helicase RecG
LQRRQDAAIDRIFEGSLIFGRPWPDYSESTSRNVKLFITRAKADLAFAKLVADEQNRQGKPLSIYTLMILSVLNLERRTTIDRIVELLKVTPTQAYAVIKKLQKEGKLELLCDGKYSKYKTVD